MRIVVSYLHDSPPSRDHASAWIIRTSRTGRRPRPSPDGRPEVAAIRGRALLQREAVPARPVLRRSHPARADAARRSADPANPSACPRTDPRPGDSRHARDRSPSRSSEPRPAPVRRDGGTVWTSRRGRVKPPYRDAPPPREARASRSHRRMPVSDDAAGARTMSIDRVASWSNHQFAIAAMSSASPSPSKSASGIEDSIESSKVSERSALDGVQDQTKPDEASTVGLM